MPNSVPVCSTEGCDRKRYARGLCSAHHRAALRTGTLAPRPPGEKLPAIAGERWRPVAGFEGEYEVSDHGRVFSVPRGPKVPGGILKPGVHAKGHLQVQLGKGRMVQVHHLVMFAFVGPRPEGLEICHGNGDPADNRLGNLRYGTRSDNEWDKVRHGTHQQASKTHCPQGHPYSAENTYFSASRNHRKCKTCTKERARLAYLRKRRVAA